MTRAPARVWSQPLPLLALVFLTPLLLLTLWSAPAAATKCLPPTPEASYEDVIFRASVTAPADRGYALSVSKVYRGEVPKVVKVMSGGMKGFGGFEVGSQYLVYARMVEGGLFVHLCGPTHRLPRSDYFVEGLWAQFSPAQYGPARAANANGTIASGRPVKDDAPPPPPTTSAPPADTTSAAPPVDPQPVLPPSAQPSAVPFAEPKLNGVRPKPQGSAGCAGCAIARQASSGRDAAAIVLLLLGLAVTIRRRR